MLFAVANATDVSLQYILSLFNDRPSMKLDEAVMAASERFDITVGAHTISNVLLRHKWSRKSAAKVAE